ncbi:MAG: 3-oxoacyl-[acyl-carrier-protein] reductase [Bacteroidales bacterium]|nr:3-oxoacyl-[acyl-carrier-protein] reductase [Bacteroidales bacterium]
MKLLENKVVIVTGAARGIGRSIAKKMAIEGANVAFTDIKEDDNFYSLISELEKYGVKVKGYISDASKYNECQSTVDEIYNVFGSIDVLVNNAGITRDALLLRMTEEQWDVVLSVNLKSVFNMTKAVQRYMLKQKEGAIINITSVVGISGNIGQANYAASKAGIIGFTKTVAKELGSRNIRCNAVAPGFIETDMTKALPDNVVKNWIEKIPMKRPGLPDEVSNVVVFLASNLASYINGQVISVCGGML